MMKYVALHRTNFYFPSGQILAFLISALNVVLIIMVEFINLWNLSDISSNVKVLMFDFIALGVIAEFDDYFVGIYRHSNFWPLLNGDL